MSSPTAADPLDAALERAVTRLGDASGTSEQIRQHFAFGERACAELVQTAEGRRGVQAGIDKLFPTLPAFFGRAQSKNNELYRKWGIKERTNEEMRADYLERARVLVEKIDLKLPVLPAA